VLTRNTSTTYLTGSASPAESVRSQPPVATPVATPAPGTYGGSVQVSLSTGTAGASIRYTLDGSNPTSTTGTLYSAPFTLSTSATVKAIAYKTGETNSAVMNFSYTIVSTSNAAFTSAASTVAETAGSATAWVRRNGDTSGVATVQYATADGSATAGEDYTATSGTLTWTDGDSSDKSITVPILNDSIYYEGDESFTITLSNPSGLALGNPSAHVVTITDDDTDAPPVITRLIPAASPASVEVGATLELEYQVQDDGLDPVDLQWSKFSGPGEVTFGDETAAVTGAQFSQTGTYVIRLTANDGLHTVTSDLGVEVSAAAVTYTLNYSAGTGGSLSGNTAQTVAEGASGSPVTAVPDSGYRFTQWNDGSSANPRTDSNVTADLSFTANFAANQAPVIAEGASVSVSMSEDGSPLAFSLTLNATDSEDPAEALVWSIFTQATYGTAAVSGTGASKPVAYAPEADWHGNDSFVLRVTDADGGTAEITVQVTVTPVNDAPVVANPPADQSVNVGQELSFVFPENTFADVDDAVLSYSATLADGSPLPAWLGFNPATRTFGGTPASGDIGSILIKLTATDSGALSVHTGFAIHVSTAITTLYWGGGTADLAAGTSVDSRTGDATLLAGTWDSSLLNWNENLAATTGHRAWSDGNLAYFKFAAPASSLTPDVELAQDIQIAGLTAELAHTTPTGSGFDFISNNATPRALTLAPGSTLRVRTSASSHSVALRRAGHVAGRGGVTLEGFGGFAYEAFNASGVPNTAILDIESGAITGPVEVRSGRLRQCHHPFPCPEHRRGNHRRGNDSRSRRKHAPHRRVRIRRPIRAHPCPRNRRRQPRRDHRAGGSFRALHPSPPPEHRIKFPAQHPCGHRWQPACDFLGTQRPDRTGRRQHPHRQDLPPRAHRPPRWLGRTAGHHSGNPFRTLRPPPCQRLQPGLWRRCGRTSSFRWRSLAHRREPLLGQPQRDPRCQRHPRPRHHRCQRRFPRRSRLWKTRARHRFTPGTRPRKPRSERPSGLRLRRRLARRFRPAHPGAHPRARLRLQPVLSAHRKRDHRGAQLRLDHRPQHIHPQRAGGQGRR
jgi:hypothetical protein